MRGKFEPAGFVVDLVAILTVLFGLVMAGYLIYVQKSLGWVGGTCGTSRFRIALPEGAIDRDTLWHA